MEGWIYKGNHDGIGGWSCELEIFYNGIDATLKFEQKGKPNLKIDPFSKRNGFGFSQEVSGVSKGNYLSAKEKLYCNIFGDWCGGDFDG